MPPSPSSAAAAAEDKTVAIVSYLTIIGFIIAIIMHSSKKTLLGAFHLRQALGLFVTGFVGWIVLMIIPVLGWILLPFYMLAILVLVIIGLIGAINGQMKPVPVLGQQYQKWFGGAFN